MKSKLRKILQNLCLEVGANAREGDVEFALKQILRLFKVNP